LENNFLDNWNGLLFFIILKYLNFFLNNNAFLILYSEVKYFFDNNFNIQTEFCHFDVIFLVKVDKLIRDFVLNVKILDIKRKVFMNF